MDFDESTAGMALAGGWHGPVACMALAALAGLRTQASQAPQLSWFESPSPRAPLAKVSGLGCLLCQVPKNAPAALRRGHGGMARQCTSGALTPLPGGRGETQCSFPIHGTRFILLTPFRKTDKFKKLEMLKKQKTPKNAKCRKNKKTGISQKR